VSFDPGTYIFLEACSGVPEAGATQAKRGGAPPVRDSGFFRGSQEPGHRICNAALARCIACGERNGVSRTNDSGS